MSLRKYSQVNSVAYFKKNSNAFYPARKYLTNYNIRIIICIQLHRICND